MIGITFGSKSSDNRRVTGENMPGGDKKIGPQDGIETRFKKGESGNKWGRPPRLVGQILKDVKSDGMEAVTASQVSEVISVLLNYSVEQVKTIAADKTLPILIQRTARRFAGASDKDWDWVVEKALDRAHGKSTNRHEIAGKDGKPIEFKDVSLEDKLAALKLLQGKKDGT